MLKYVSPFHGRDFAHGRVPARIENRALRENPGQTDLSAQGILSYDVILRGFCLGLRPRQNTGYLNKILGPILKTPGNSVYLFIPNM